MDTEQNMKQNSEFSRESCCREAKIIFCKILCTFPNFAQFTTFCQTFCGRRIAESWRDCLSYSYCCSTVSNLKLTSRLPQVFYLQYCSFAQFRSSRSWLLRWVKIYSLLHELKYNHDL